MCLTYNSVCLTLICKTVKSWKVKTGTIFYKLRQYGGPQSTYGLFYFKSFFLCFRSIQQLKKILRNFWNISDQVDKFTRF